MPCKVQYGIVITMYFKFLAYRQRSYLIRCVDISILLKKKANYFFTTILAGLVEWCAAILNT